jgi:hypothetical protein
MKALAKEPSERFATVREFAKALQDSDEQTAPALHVIKTVSLPSEEEATEDEAPAVPAKLPHETSVPANLTPVSLAASSPIITEQVVEMSKTNEKTDELEEKASPLIEAIPPAPTQTSRVSAGRTTVNLVLILCTLLVLSGIIFSLLRYNLLSTLLNPNQPIVQLHPSPTPIPTSTPTPTSTPIPTTPAPTSTPIPTTPAPIPADNHVTGSCSSIPTEGNCTGKDPNMQGCLDGVKTVGGIYYIKDASGADIGQVEVRTSVACKSNWARTTVFTSCGHVSVTANVERLYQVYQGIAYPYKNYPYPYQKDCVTGKSIDTNMVYAPGNVKAQACGTIDGSEEVCTEPV